MVEIFPNDKQLLLTVIYEDIWKYMNEDIWKYRSCALKKILINFYAL